MSELELLYKWCDLCLEYPNPLLYRDIRDRGLSFFVENLPKNIEQAKKEVAKRLEARELSKKMIKTSQTEKENMAKELRNRDATLAKEFYSKINIPFKFDVGEKEVLSGLSVNSMGDGRRKNTVIHLLVEEDWTQGKFTRKKGDFLCTSKSGSNGNSWSGQNLKIRYVDGENEEYIPKITCKQCLKTIKKYENEI